MGGLIYKDFLTNRKSIFVALGAMLYCGIMIIMPNVIGTGDEGIGVEDMRIFLSLYGILMLFAIFFISGAFQGNILKNDESRRWAYFITSTPMLKKHIEAKYWFIMIMSLSTVFITVIFDALNCILFKAVSLQAFIITAFYIQMFLRAVEIPFLVRFGTSMGGYYKAGVLVLAVLIVGIYLLFGDLSHFGSMDTFYEWFLNAMNGGVKTLQIFMAVMPFVSAGMYYLSYRLSCRLYLKGAENFEE